jgi:drug/metabolite transporter (DMT)-like permease
MAPSPRVDGSRQDEGMLSVVIGLLGAAIYGGSDFIGGLAAQRTSSVRVTAFASIAGLVLLVAGLPFVPSAWTPAALAWGAAGGLAGALCVALLYACLAIGPMSVLTPVVALTMAVVPVAVGLAAGERLDVIGYVGIGVGLVAVLLICLTRHAEAARVRPRALLMALGSGLGGGLYLVFIDQTSTASGLAPLVAAFAVSGASMFAALLVMRLVRGPSSRRTVSSRDTLVTSALIVACGLTDALASLLLLIALRLGELTIVSVLSALSPAGTIVLAALILRERIALTQGVGLGLAGLAAVFLALA